MGKRHRSFILLLGLLLALSACGGNSGAGWGPGSTEGNASTQHIVAQGGLIIFAPPTLQPAFSALTDAFLKAHRLNLPYTFNYSGDKVNATTANTLADTDLFIVDNQQTMREARAIGFVQSNGTPLASDTLSVVLPAANPGKIHSLQDLARPGLRYLGISPDDGLSGHIQATIESMMLAPTFGQQYSARVFGNLYANYTDGPAATQAIATPPAAGDFSIVYHTNYLAAQKQFGATTLRELTIPTQFNPPRPILAALASQAHNPSLAQQLIDYMRSPQSQIIWRQYGFQFPA